MLLGDIVKSCLGCEPMGSMCAKQQPNTEPDYAERPRRKHRDDPKGMRAMDNKQDEEIQPLVNQDAIKINMEVDPNKNNQVNQPTLHFSVISYLDNQRTTIIYIQYTYTII